MAAVREIKICLSSNSEPYSFKFSEDVDFDDIRDVLQEAIENFSIQNKIDYEAFNPHSLESIDLRNFMANGSEMILLGEKGKSPEKPRHSHVEGQEEEMVLINGQSNSIKATPAKVHAGAADTRDKSPGRAGIVNQMSKRSGKPTTESVVQSHLFAKRQLKVSAENGHTVNGHVHHDGGKEDEKLAIVKNELDALYERSIHSKGSFVNQDAEINSSPKKINLEEEKQPYGQVYDPKNPKIDKTVSLFCSNPNSWNTGSVATTNRDGNDPNIWSKELGHPPFTYSLAGYNYVNERPPPKYLPYEEIRVLKPLDLESIFKGQEITKDGELKITDKESLKNQEGIVSDVLKRLAKSIAEGRGVVGVSLPIRIFEPRSLVERITDWWAFAPVYLTPGAQKTDPLERFKSVIAFAMSGLYVSVTPFKPFNPILGETYQGEFPGHGISVNVEHTSHHPPIANFYVAHNDWKFYGRYEFKGDISTLGNYLAVDQEGPNTVEFADGHKITFHLPTIRIGGMIHGDKKTRYIGSVRFIDRTNKLKCVIKFDPSDRRPMYDKKRKDVYTGLIYKYKETKKEIDDDKMKDIEERIEEVHGQWLKCLYFGETKWWDINEQTPVRTIPVENPLCSDWRYREDLIWVKRGDRKIAETWKLFLEVRQRAEKAMRIEGKKKREKERKQHR